MPQWCDEKNRPEALAIVAAREKDLSWPQGGTEYLSFRMGCSFGFEDDPRQYLDPESRSFDVM